MAIALTAFAIVACCVLASSLITGARLRRWRSACVERRCACSALRDKTVIVWSLSRDSEGQAGFPRRALRGHSHFVQVGPAPTPSGRSTSTPSACGR